MFVVIAVLNFLALSPQSEHPHDSTLWQTGTFTSQQIEAHRHLESCATELVSDHKQPRGLRKMDAKIWLEVLRKHRMSYDGKIVAKAMDLTWAQIEPALPPKKLAGKVGVEDLAEGRMKELLLDPALSILPLDQWPKENRSAPVRATDEEWDLIARGCYDRNIFRIAEENEIWKDAEGQVISAGAFGVGKGKLLERSESRSRGLEAHHQPGSFQLPADDDTWRQRQAALLGTVGLNDSRRWRISLLEL
jgi:hypothetical protein